VGEALFLVYLLHNRFDVCKRGIEEKNRVAGSKLIHEVIGVAKGQGGPRSPGAARC
jgi:hypothetical protein